jgi:hypothetical protein
LFLITSRLTSEDTRVDPQSEYFSSVNERDLPEEVLLAKEKMLQELSKVPGRIVLQYSC